jgi:hypothetical protein
VVEVDVEVVVVVESEVEEIVEVVVSKLLEVGNVEFDAEEETPEVDDELEILPVVDEASFAVE